MATMDGPLCCKWSPGSKPEKQQLHANTDRVSDYKKLFRNNAMHVCCNSESSLAAKTTFSFYTFTNCE